MMERNELNSWSIEDSECSNDGPGSKSINTQLDSLRLNSLDSCKSEEEDIISRGNRAAFKSRPTSKSQQKNNTSLYVLDLIENCDSSKSSGYSSSKSPSSDIISNIQTYEKPSISSSVSPISEERQLTKKFSSGKSMKKILQNFVYTRLNKKKSNVDLGQWCFDFGDTNLIKSCRRGQVTAVRESIRELLENQQHDLINHQNTANETALSIATYQMNEVLINLLLQYGASPHQQLNMKNNVLHIAADLAIDIERKTFGYLVNGIKIYQSNYLWETISTKNIFQCDPLDILRLHRDAQVDDEFVYHRLTNQINETQQLIDSLYNHFSMI